LPYLGAAVLAASGGWLADVYLVTGIALVGFATGMGARVLPSHLGRAKRWSGKSVFRYIVLPGVVGSAALGAGIAPHLPWHEISVEVPASPSIRPEWFKSLSLDPTAQTYILAFTSVFIALIARYVGGWLGAASESDKDLARSNSRAFLRNEPIWMIGALGSAAFYVWGITLLEGVSCNLLAAGSGPCAWQRDVATTFIVGWGILSQLVATVLFVAFRVIPQGEELSPDLDREWLARLSAQKIRLATAWTLFAAGALLFRHVLVDLLEYVTSSTAAWDWLGGVSGIVGAISGAIAILGGRAANTGYRGNPGSARTLLPFDSVVGLATLFFIIVLLSVIGQIEFKAADWVSQLSTPTPLPIVDAHLVVIILAVGVLALTSTHINVNRFSLNGMYRNRLARAFLGAAREKRHDADPFTGFAPSDNIRLHTLKAVNIATGRRVLMPVVNVALDLMGGSRLAWQERKAQAFIFTPIACGSAALAQDQQTGECAGRYIRSKDYAGNEPDLALPGEGVSLATAVALSGRLPARAWATTPRPQPPS
jgi:hypothetical protein